MANLNGNKVNLKKRQIIGICKPVITIARIEENVPAVEAETTRLYLDISIYLERSVEALY